MHKDVDSQAHPRGGQASVPSQMDIFRLGMNPSDENVARAIDVVGFGNKVLREVEIRRLCDRPFLGGEFRNTTLPKILNAFISARFQNPDDVWEYMLLMAGEVKGRKRR